MNLNNLRKHLSEDGDYFLATVYRGILIFEKVTYLCKPSLSLSTFKKWRQWKKNYPFDSEMFRLDNRENSVYPLGTILKTHSGKTSVHLFRVNKDSSVTQVYPLFDKFELKSDVLRIKDLDPDLAITSLLDLKEMYSSQVVKSFILATDITQTWLKAYRASYENQPSPTS